MLRVHKDPKRRWRGLSCSRLAAAHARRGSMPQYNFKTIQIVPTSKDFIDIVLSRTQRQTPTVVHNGWAINRIRQFYMRKARPLCCCLTPLFPFFKLSLATAGCVSSC